MSARRTSYGKVARERDKKAKAAAKREQRQSRGTDTAEAPDEAEETSTPSGPELSTPELLQMVEELHRRFDAGLLSYDEYEEQKADLLGQIKLD